MTRKHFSAIAATIKAEHEHAQSFPGTETGATCAIAMLARRLADTFLDFNPRFDRSRFLTACGLD